MTIRYIIKNNEQSIIDQLKFQRDSLSLELEPIILDLKSRLGNSKYVEEETKRFIELTNQAYTQIPNIVRDALLQDPKINKISVNLINTNIYIY